MELCSRSSALRHKICMRHETLRNTFNLVRQFGTVQAEIASKKPVVWEPVIGLEIHAQIKTQSKLFSSARNLFMAPPNSQVSEFDAALPGTLPVLNKTCVEAAVRTALALQCKINHKSYFDRKHYFYADLPKGYQITQHQRPIAINGYLSIPTTLHMDASVKWKNIRIEQIQLEQDSGKSLHEEKEKISLIDLNRAGVGLLEIVTAPDFSSSEEVATFVLDLQLTMRKLGTCLGKIAEGNMRVDANVSLHHPGEPLGTRSEVKNIAGISGLVQAIDYEISRHKNLLEQGQNIVNETRDFVADKGITVSMRDKEEFQDYRFLPEPNLPPLILYTNDNLPSWYDHKRHVNVDDIRRKLPEALPTSIRTHLIDVYHLNIMDSSFLMENNLAEYFISVMNADPTLSYITVYHWLKIQLLGLVYELNIKVEASPVSPERMAELLGLLESNQLNDTNASLTFEVMVKDIRTASEIVEENDWRMITDVTTIEELCREAMKSSNLDLMFKKYRPGEHSRPKNKKTVASIVSEVMKRSNDKAHTKITQSVAKNLLDKCFREYTTEKS